LAAPFINEVAPRGGESHQLVWSSESLEGEMLALLEKGKKVGTPTLTPSGECEWW